MRKLISVAVMVVVLLVVSGSTAPAGKPRIQACYGKDVSGYAQAGRDYGQIVADYASTTHALGHEIQLHLAGEVPDTVFPNSCND